jgi:hypothetical protein
MVCIDPTHMPEVGIHIDAVVHLAGGNAALRALSTCTQSRALEEN